MRGYAMLGLSALYLAGASFVGSYGGENGTGLAFIGCLAFIAGGVFLAIDGRRT